MTPAQRVGVGSWIVAAAMLLLVDTGTLARSVAPSLFAAELAMLDRVAGIRDDDGAVRGEALPVRVDVEEPQWGAAGLAAVEGDDAYRIGEGPHRLIGEMVVDGDAMMARWSLERRGWSMHAPAPTTRRLLPALAIVPLLLGALAVRRWRHPAIVALVTAAVAQLLAFAWPWPPEFPVVDAGARLAASPLLAPILRIARAMDDHAAAIAAGVVALCVVLAWFDHRRSRERGSAIAGVAIIVGVLAWCEAAARVSCGAWLGTASGIVAAVAIAVFFFATRSPATAGAQ